ncbi:MAG: hypothetical protein GY757_35835, partial [bacterium]|nr:hypothetical protein [bacterium]
ETIQATAVVKADEEAKKIYVYVSGRQRHHYFAVIRHTLRDINRSFEKLKVSERVPTPGNPAVTVDYLHLLRLKEMNEINYIPEGSDRIYKIDDLLQEFKETEQSTIAVNLNKRMTLLDELDELILDPATLEKQIHKILEDNLWLLKREYPLISSNKTLKNTVEVYLGKKYKGDTPANRPDLLLAQDKNVLLIELKKPGHNLTVRDAAQAVEYKNDLKKHLDPEIDILLIGGGIKENISKLDFGAGVTFRTFNSLISDARNNLKWLLQDLDSSPESEMAKFKL